MNFTISILDINIDQSQQSFLRTVGVLAKTAVPEFFFCFTPQSMIMTVMMILQDPRNRVLFIHLWYVRIPKLFRL